MYLAVDLLPVSQSNAESWRIGSKVKMRRWRKSSGYLYGDSEATTPKRSGVSLIDLGCSALSSSVSFAASAHATISSSNHQRHPFSQTLLITISIDAYSLRTQHLNLDATVAGNTRSVSLCARRAT